MKKKFWTITDGKKFLNSNLMREDSENITEAVRFSTEEGCERFFKNVRKDLGFKIAEVECDIKIINQ